jgi:hypothetical protein
VSLRRRLLPVGLLALLVGLAVVGWLSRSGGARGSRAERLAAAAKDLAARAPRAWAGIVPLEGPAFWDARPPPEAGLHVVAPRGLVLDARPRLRWTGVPLAASVELRLLRAPSEAGPALWTRNGTARHLEFPPEEPALAPGAYGVEARAAPGADPARASFEVAGPEARERFAAVRAATAEAAPPDLRTLLDAHAAARLGLLLEAERLAQQALAEDARDDDALALLRWVHAQLGETEGRRR